MFRRLLPRHLEIIYEINARFLDEVRIRFCGDEERVARLSLIDERGERYVRMAHLACVGSHAINGVAELHSELLKRDVLADFHELWPEKFSNKTNGVTPRRWIALANPAARAPDQRRHRRRAGSRDLDRARAALEPLAEDAGFRDALARGQARQQGGVRRLRAPRTGCRGRPAVDVRRAGQAHPRVQAPAPQHPARHRALRAAEVRASPRTRRRAPSSSAARPRPAITWPSSSSS